MAGTSKGSGWPVFAGFCGGALGALLALWAAYEAFTGGAWAPLGVDFTADRPLLGVLVALFGTPLLFKGAFVAVLLPSMLIEKLTRR
ncbi:MULTISPECIES: hypothetical protein [unclassified Streptomyces]|uniref:hypothetical protein n=1 Tax=unclassified Streptomyces TaxID=2593676 RepID=UPI00365FEBA6